MGCRAWHGLEVKKIFLHVMAVEDKALCLCQYGTKTSAARQP
ncbi:hypothetical protein DWUX_834 [Desulfovibrio diazotrophicus]|nr:hypothetical protein DWUX_834 [Desulfovibrio diazotrophicus]